MSINPLTEARDEFDIPVELHILDKVSKVVPARIRRVSPALFALTSEEPLASGTRLALAHEGHRLEGEVLTAAQQSAGLYALAVKVIAAGFGEVRSELRLPTDLAATVRVAGREAELTARVVDMSPAGMGVELDQRLASGTKVCIGLEQGLAFGEIRFCREIGENKWLAGFRLEEYIAQEAEGN